jgi:hypothetical protein
VKTKIHFSAISGSNLLRMRNVSDKPAKKIITRTLFTQFFFKSCHLGDNVEKYCRARQVTDDYMVLENCMLDT